MNQIDNFIQNSPYSLILSSFLSGLLFSGISWGIVYVILFLIFWEILYFGYVSVNSKKWDMDYRITVLMAALLGYLVGAFFHDQDDHWNAWDHFAEDCDYYGKDFGWFN